MVVHTSLLMMRFRRKKKNKEKKATAAAAKTQAADNSAVSCTDLTASSTGGSTKVFRNFTVYTGATTVGLVAMLTFSCCLLFLWPRH